MKVLLTAPSNSLYLVFTLTTPSDNLFRVYTLTAKAYMETLLKDESPPSGSSDSLYRVFALTTYVETLLKDGSPPDGLSHSLSSLLPEG